MHMHYCNNYSGTVYILIFIIMPHLQIWHRLDVLTLGVVISKLKCYERMSSLNRGWTSWRSTFGHVTVASWVHKGDPWWIHNQTSIQSKQLWRSRGSDEIDAEVADRGPECFYHTSRASVRKSGEHASHWMYKQFSLPEIPSGIHHESERKTRNDGHEECGVLTSLCWMLSNLCWRDREVVESSYGKALKNGQEQESYEWNCHACPKDCAYHQLAGSKDPWEGGQLGKKKGS